MSDLISRQDAIDKLRDMGYMDENNEVEEALIRLPSAEPDIIACGDCKHYIIHDKRCGYWNHGVKPLMWCSEGERRTNE